MEHDADFLGKIAFSIDRGYDNTKMFLKLNEMGQDYVIRLKSNRRLLYHSKWTMATELRNQQKRSRPTSYTAVSIMKHNFPMSKYRLPRLEKTSIWYLFMESQSIQ